MASWQIFCTLVCFVCETHLEQKIASNHVQPQSNINIQSSQNLKITNPSRNRPNIPYFAQNGRPNPHHVNQFYLYGRPTRLLRPPNEIPDVLSYPSTGITYTSSGVQTNVYVWSAWSAWSRCSKSCDGGVKIRARNCKGEKRSMGSIQTNQTPTRCRGYRHVYQSCNKKPCLSPNEIRKEKYDSRLKQCSRYNKTPYLGDVYKWIPYMRNGLNECKLNCLADGFRLFRSFGIVLDGILCGRVGGYECQKGRCVLGKRAKKSISILAKHSNVQKSKETQINANAHQLKNTNKTQWVEVQRIFEINDYMSLGYNAAFTVPRGAINISIEELSPSRNYLVLKTGGVFVLNGRWKVEPSKTFFGAGVKIVYVTDKDFKEKITIDGPLLEDLHVMLLYQNEIVRVGFNYTIPKAQQILKQNSTLSGKFSHFPLAFGYRQQQRSSFYHDQTQPVFPPRDINRHQYYSSSAGQYKRVTSKIYPGNEDGNSDVTKTVYKWQIGGISKCDLRCGGGEQTFMYRCFEANGLRSGKFVDNKKCLNVNQPPIKKRVCNPQPCPIRWYVTEWTACSKTCGEYSTQHRSVLCKKTIFANKTTAMETVNSSECRLIKKPSHSRDCMLAPCSFQWQVEAWGECSASCDNGVQRRMVYCKHHKGFKIPEENCNSIAKPNTTQFCMWKPCSTTWFTSEWTPCSSACSNGYQSRKVICASSNGAAVAETSCSFRQKPHQRRTCVGTICTKGFWVTTNWSKCTSNCGIGKQYRNVFCMSKNGQSYQEVDDKKCSEKKPYAVKTCRNTMCPPLWYTDHWSQCTKTCGGGQENRHEMCLSKFGTSVRGCLFVARPRLIRPCNEVQCPTSVVQGKQASGKAESEIVITPESTLVKKKGGESLASSLSVTPLLITSSRTSLSASIEIKTSKMTPATASPSAITSATQSLSTSPTIQTRKTSYTPSTAASTTLSKSTSTSTAKAATTALDLTTLPLSIDTTLTKQYYSTSTIKRKNPIVKFSRPTFNRLGGQFASLSRNICVDMQSKGYCYVISVRLKFCKIQRFKVVCCRSCKNKNG